MVVPCRNVHIDGIVKERNAIKHIKLSITYVNLPDRRNGNASIPCVALPAVDSPIPFVTKKEEIPLKINILMTSTDAEDVATVATVKTTDKGVDSQLAAALTRKNEIVHPEG